LLLNNSRLSCYLTSRNFGEPAGWLLLLLLCSTIGHLSAVTLPRLTAKLHCAPLAASLAARRGGGGNIRRC